MKRVCKSEYPQEERLRVPYEKSKTGCCAIRLLSSLFLIISFIDFQESRPGFRLHQQLMLEQGILF
jgi:hypothetical protein